MDLGNFSVSLSVKDLPTSRDFYEKLGFETYLDSSSQGWVILRNRTSTIGLFQGMFEGNLLTFNPGWDQDTREMEAFTDIREIQRELRTQGISIESEVDETTTGPASFVVVDPDGNTILIDQHV